MKRKTFESALWSQTEGSLRAERQGTEVRWQQELVGNSEDERVDPIPCLPSLTLILAHWSAMALFERLHSFIGEKMKSSSVLLAKVKCEEEELIDPQEVLRTECKAKHCEKYEAKLDTCNARVRSRKKTAETCYEELLDLFHCVDHCVAKDLMKKLK